MYKRILIKISGEALAGEKRFGFNIENAQKIAVQIKTLSERGMEIGLVIGAGNIWRGDEHPELNLARAHQMGILATVLNGIYMEQTLRNMGLNARVITPFSITGIVEEFEKVKVTEYLSNKEILVFAGGTGQPFLTTDTGAVLNALKIDADVLLLAKNIDGVYDKDPRKFEDAKKYDTITYQEVLANGLQVMDLAAVAMCMEAGMKEILVFDLNEENSIINHSDGKISGTIVNRG